MAEHGFPLLFNYIDDIVYTGLLSNGCFLHFLEGSVGRFGSGNKYKEVGTSIHLCYLLRHIN